MDDLNAFHDLENTLSRASARLAGMNDLLLQMDGPHRDDVLHALVAAIHADVNQALANLPKQQAA